ncbi:MAG TPA: exo-alpha-sialidase [Blastocatellia bacterium]|nr:exo-alpha-sialidase [Blastocatellia bacterium]HMV86182.1 exo-alpha-sialidase [Blastocatellia bacterium]HMX24390.1 exo-alpha-sialidase [Blastocatellia bacterium]HMY72116.1 exo-alpha-sialidase [Blastocatellia bacterium]HMZ16988.1 exo-alpha-sialidase [Blastocatellia bacterium]
MKTLFLPLLAFLCLTVAPPVEAQTPKLKLLSVKKIWAQGEHNAFTDLIRFRNHWFCIFREGKAHADGEGKLRVLTSLDGETWESAALLELLGKDLRDAKFSIAPGNRLMLVCGAADAANRNGGEFLSFVSFSMDGKQWSKLERVNGFEGRTWLWRVVWHKGTAYGAAYSWDDARRMWAVIARSRDGVNYEKLSKVFADMNEAALNFDDKDALTVVFRSVDRDAEATVVQSRAPFAEWTTKTLTPDGEWRKQLGGPAVLRLPDGRMIAAGRLYRDKMTRTGVGLLDIASGKLTDLIALPSGGDNSYPGLVWHGGKVWMSYYSSHEGRTSIYLAKLEVAKR